MYRTYFRTIDPEVDLLLWKCNALFNTLNHIALLGWWQNCDIDNSSKEEIVVFSDTIREVVAVQCRPQSRKLPGTTEEKHERLQSGQSVYK